MTPPIDVPWPPIHLVSDSTTTAAPCSNGRREVRRGERVVDDERDAELAARVGERPRGSGTSRRGLPIVSTNHAFVVSSVSRTKPSTSVGSTKRTVMPSRLNVCRKMFHVPP